MERETDTQKDKCRVKQNLLGRGKLPISDGANCTVAHTTTFLGRFHSSSCSSLLRIPG